MKVGHITCDPNHNYPCKECQAPAYFVEDVMRVEYYCCPVCGAFTRRELK